MSGFKVGRIIGHVIISGFILQSCIFEDMKECVGNYFVPITIENHWTTAPDVQPDGMAYFFFPMNECYAWRFDIPGIMGGKVKLPNKDYQFLMLNDNLSSTILMNENSYDSMTVTTMPCDLFSDMSSLATGSIQLTHGQEIRMCPDIIWCDTIPFVSVGLDNISYTIPNYNILENSNIVANHGMILPAHPHRVVCTYHFNMTDITNLDGVEHICGAMSGLASSLRLYDENHSVEAVTMPFGVNKENMNSVNGEFLTFGLSSDHGMRNILSLFIWFSNGKHINYEFDVTDQIKMAPDPLDVWINLRGLDLPESDPEPGMFDVNVDTWNTIVINLSD